MRRFGDRRDGTKVRDIDGMHYIMPLIYPNRADNEAYLTMDVEIEALEKFIRERNVGRAEEDRITLFGAIIAATMKTVYKRPQLNRFYANSSLYQRNELSAAFTVKKSFDDDAEETLARIDAKADSTVDSIARTLNETIKTCKTEDDASTDAMNFVKHIPGKKLIGVLIRFFDRHGWLPKSLIETDPNQCTLFFTNIGSIGLNVGYHHLTNWGTNSIFVVIGSKINKPYYDRNGNVTMKKVIELSFTIDERISDGFYFGKSLRMLKKTLEKPDLLLVPFNE